MSETLMLLLPARLQRALRAVRRAWAQPAALEPVSRDPLDWNEAQVRARAVAARQLLTDSLLREAFATLERTYIAAWRATRSDQRAERERLWDAITVLRSVEAHLNTVAVEGALSEQQVRHLQRRSATAAPLKE